jgi:hypothetical protein
MLKHCDEAKISWEKIHKDLGIPLHVQPHAPAHVHVLCGCVLLYAACPFSHMYRAHACMRVPEHGQHPISILLRCLLFRCLPK